MNVLTQLEPKELLQKTVTEFLDFLREGPSGREKPWGPANAIMMPREGADAGMDPKRAKLSYVRPGAWDDPQTYELFLTRLGYVKTVTQIIDARMADDPEGLQQLQVWFREQTDPLFQKSPLITRARSWPEGYPGDFLTLEALYNNAPWADRGLGNFLDRYFLCRTLAIAVRSRLRKLTDLLNYRASDEQGASNWLNVACGPCRELLSVPRADNRKIWCIDQDEQSLAYAEDLLQRKHNAEFRKLNAFRLVNAEKTVQQFGELTTIYSAGLFDYIETERLTRLLAGLYQSLAKDGVLIASFKDQIRYDTFDYHWFMKWHYFLQRSQSECYALLEGAGVPHDKMTVVRDDSGVILFFVCQK